MSAKPDHGETELDRLLGVLGAACIDSGFEQRVIRGTEAKLVGAPKPNTRWAWSVGLASLVVAGSVAAAIVLQSHQPKLPLRVAVHAQNASLAPRVEVAEQQPKVGRPPHVSRHAERAPQRQAPPELEVSFPAPPIPLTEQEQLLLRVARRDDPVEIAMLNPDVRERQFADHRAEVDKFFYKPQTVDEHGNVLDANGKPFHPLSKGESQ